MQELNIQYLLDEHGHRTNVVLPVEEFEALLEDLEDLAVMAERPDEPLLSHEQVVTELKKNGYLTEDSFNVPSASR